MDLIFSQRMVIALGTAAAVLVATGSVLRIRNRGSGGRMATIAIYSGYAFFALSILIYLVLGFR